MYASFAKEMRDKLISCGLAKPDTLIGCSELEINDIKKGQNVSFLPEVYLQFLQAMGKQAGDLYTGSDYWCSALPHLKALANADLAFFDEPFRVPEDAFVFMSHQGYVRWYFHTKDMDDNPPVYLFSDDQSEPIKLNDHLSDFFDNSIKELKPSAYLDYEMKKLSGKHSNAQE